MRIDELIGRLEYFRNLFGNIPVEVENEYDSKTLIEVCADKKSVTLFVSEL